MENTLIYASLCMLFFLWRDEKNFDALYTYEFMHMSF